MLSFALEDDMGTLHFLDYLSLIVEYAFHICETAITLTFIWVYGRLAIRHILALGRKRDE
jgi:hypothetical protein